MTAPTSEQAREYSTEQSADSSAGVTIGTIDKSNDRVKKMFSEIAPRYDRMNHVLSGGTDYYWRAVTIRKAAPKGTAPILDVCTGTGDLAISYWKKGRGEIEVVGSDFTEKMLDLAREKTQGSENPDKGAGISFVQADTQELPFESDKFQIVSVAFGLRNVANTLQGLQEMKRVCLPGGRVVVLEFSLPGNRLLRNSYVWYFKNVLPKIGQFFASNSQGAYNYLPDTVSEFPYGEKLAEIMRESGLVNVEYFPLTFGIATLYIGQKPESSRC